MKNKTVIITGGSRGIGLGIATRFAELKANIVINFRQDKEQAKEAKSKLEQLGASVCCIQADITTTEGRDKLVSEAIDQYSKIDVLVNNAGRSARHGFIKGDEEEYDMIQNTNLKGPYFLAQLVAKKMIEQKLQGAIVNLCSTSSHKPTSGSYSVAKAGMLMATKVMALKLGRHGIRVNSVTPGMIKTDMSKRAWSNPEISEQLINQLPLRRRGEPIDIAGAVVFLASEEASFVTGTEIVVDGGWLVKQ